MAKRNIAKEIEEGLTAIVADLDGTGPKLKARFIPTPQVSEIRKRMRLSQAKFSNRFGLNQRTVQDWEQGRRQPDQTAALLLNVIQENPTAVVRVLSKVAGTHARKVAEGLRAKASDRPFKAGGVVFAGKRASHSVRAAAKKR